MPMTSIRLGRGLAALAGLVLAGAAEASPAGLLIRLDSGGESLGGPVVVVLQGDGGKTDEITLKDDGAQPDVSAGDLSYAGAAAVAGDSFEISVRIGEKTLSGGAISWSPEDQMRDLDIRLSGGSVSLQAGVAGSGGGGGGGGPPGGAAMGSGGGGAPGGGGGGGVPTADATAGPGLFIGLGLGLVALLGLLWLWVRGRSAGPDLSALRGLETLPEASVLGEAAPPLSEGLQLLVHTADDEPALIRALLTTMARTHRVVVVAPARVEVPSVPGGPVYRGASGRPSEVGAAVDAVLATPGRNVAVLLIGQGGSPDLYRDLADVLPTGAGGFALVSQPVEIELARGEIAASVDGFTLTREGRPWPLRRGSQGQLLPARSADPSSTPV